MLKCLFPIIYTCCFPLFVMAQGSFYKGFLINSKQDTLRGELQLTYQQDLPVLAYKNAVDATAVFYKPGEIQAVHFNNGAYFESLQVAENQSKDFVQCLLKGAVSLYKYQNSNGNTRYFLRIKDAGLRELLEEKTILKEEASGKQYQFTNKLYHKLLAEAFLDCPAILPQLGSYEFTAKSLAKAVKDFHACKNEAFQSYDKIQLEVKRPEIGIYSGRNFLSLTNGVFSDYEGAWGYQAGAYANFFLFKSRSKNSIQVGAEWAEHRYKIAGTNRGYAIRLVTVPVLFKNYFRTGNWNPHLGLGMNAKISTSDSAVFRRVAGLLVNAGMDYHIGKVKLCFNLQGRLINQSTFFVNIGIAY